MNLIFLRNVFSVAFVMLLTFRVKSLRRRILKMLPTMTRRFIYSMDVLMRMNLMCETI